MNDSQKTTAGKKQVSAIKLKDNDEAWGAPSPNPTILISEKVDRYLQQKVPN